MSFSDKSTQSWYIYIYAYIYIYKYIYIYIYIYIYVCMYRERNMYIVLTGLNPEIHKLFEQSSVLILVICLVWYPDMVLPDEILKKVKLGTQKEKGN